MSKLSYIVTGQGITVFLDGKTYPISRSTKNFDLVQTAIKNGDQVALKRILEIKQTVVDQSNGLVKIVGSELYYGDRAIHGTVVERIFNMLGDGFDVAPMLAFVNNLMENPDFRAVNELYGFLEACNLPITADGHFLAYKVIRNDYKDCHSGKMDNSVGATVSMPRNMVNPDKNQTCSSGLHFCSAGYLPHFGTGGNRVVVLKINPRDVVSIPTDYNNAKGRACLYEVVEELPLDEAGRLLRGITPDFTNEHSGDSYEHDDRDELEEEFDAEFDAELEEEFEEEEEAFSLTSDDDAPLPGTLLTPNDIRWIRQALADGDLSIAAIAREVESSPRAIARIRDGESFAHIR